MSLVDFVDPCACSCLYYDFARWLYMRKGLQLRGHRNHSSLCLGCTRFSMARHQTGSKKRRNQARVTEKTAAVQETIDTAERERVEALEQAEDAERLDLRIVFHGAFPSQSYFRKLK